MKKYRSLFVCMVLVLALLLTGCDMIDYKKATKLYENEEYEEAAEMFDTIPDYKDSADLAQECRRQLANDAFDDGDYAEAAEMYEELGDYKDCAEMAEECHWYLGKEAFDSENWQDALAEFEGLTANPEDVEAPDLDTMRLLAQAHLDYAGGDYEAVLTALDSYEDKAAEAMYTDSALQVFTAAFDAAAEAQDAEATVTAVTDYLTRTEDTATVSDKLNELFTTLVDEKNYAEFVYMDSVVAGVTDTDCTAAAADTLSQAYAKRVQAYLTVGSWLRTDGVSLKGGIMEIAENEDGALVGTLTNVDDIEGSTLFFVGDIKWKDLSIKDETHFSFSDYFVSSSDGEITNTTYVDADAVIDYENGIITVTEPDGTTGNGATQTWELKVNFDE